MCLFLCALFIMGADNKCRLLASNLFKCAIMLKWELYRLFVIELKSAETLILEGYKTNTPGIF